MAIAGSAPTLGGPNAAVAAEEARLIAEADA